MPLDRPDGAVQAVGLDHVHAAADKDGCGGRRDEALGEAAGGDVLQAQAAALVHSREDESALVCGVAPAGVGDHRQAARVQREPRPPERHAGRKRSGEFLSPPPLDEDEAALVRPEEHGDRAGLSGGEGDEVAAARHGACPARMPAAVGGARCDP